MNGIRKMSPLPNLLRRTTEALFFMGLAALALCLWPAGHWSGISAESEKTFPAKLFNRFYFVSTTFSSVGYGDITPTSVSSRAAVVVLQVLVTVAVIDKLLVHSALSRLRT